MTARNISPFKDFVLAHGNFEDLEWDGEPLEPEPPVSHPAVIEGEPGGGLEDEGGEYDPEEPTQKLVIKLADGKARSIQFIATTTYWGPDGKPMSAQQFLQRLFGDLSGLILDEDALRAEWSDPDRREKLIAVLADRGYDADKLDDMRRPPTAICSTYSPISASSSPPGPAPSGPRPPPMAIWGQRWRDARIPHRRPAGLCRPW